MTIPTVETDIYGRLPASWLGYGIDDHGLFLNVCGCCSDVDDAKEWAKRHDLRTKIKPCVAHYAKRVEAQVA